MRLPLRKEGAPQFYSIAAAAREIGIHPQTLRYLETRKVVTPLRVKGTFRQVRIFTEQDIQTVLTHYQRAGGVKSEQSRWK